jgi:hypothetical protein
VLFECLSHGVGQHHSPIFLSLSAPHGDLPPLEIEILHPQLEALLQPEPRTIEQRRHDPRNANQLPAIRASLERLPGVRVIDVVGWDELWPVFGPEAIRARLQIEEHGVLILRDLSTSDLAGGGSFWIDQIGKRAPKVAMVDDQGRQR